MIRVAGRRTVVVALRRGHLRTLERRFSVPGFARRFLLRRLERQALADPRSPEKEASFVSALLREDPRAVVRHVQRRLALAGTPVGSQGLGADGQLVLPSNPAVATDYVRALHVSGQASPALTAALGGEGAAGVGGVGGSASSHAAALAGLRASGTEADPVIVSMQRPSLSWSIASLVFRGALLVLGISLVGSFFDEKGISSRVMGSAVHQAEKSEKRFTDVMGCDEAKRELEEIVLYLKDPGKFTRLGGSLPKGMLLTGPPGTGKTLLARAIAGEAGCAFFYSSGSEFEEMYVGVGARRVRDLFDAARKKSPCIIFIDEIDAIGGSRHLKEQQAMKMTLNQLLVEMDGFEPNTGVIVIAATNFPESLDKALTRPGRFDRHVEVPLPDVRGRHQILELYTKKTPLSKDVDLHVLSRGTPGFSGADLYNLVNQACLQASKLGFKAVRQLDLEYAKDKILMGAERQSAIIMPETARNTAFHEGGHALVALKTDGADPIHKATIMPRGRALGMVMQLPEGDQTSMSRRQMLAKLDVCMAGRAAEELVFGEDNVTSGASSDIQQATRLARAMVTQWGFSDRVGVVFHGKMEDASPETQQAIDDEVRLLLQEAYSRAKELLRTHRRELDMIANALLEHETLSGSELMEILKGKRINAKERSRRPSSSTQGSVGGLPIPGRATRDDRPPAEGQQEA